MKGIGKCKDETEADAETAENGKVESKQIDEKAEAAPADAKKDVEMQPDDASSQETQEEDEIELRKNKAIASQMMAAEKKDS